MVKMISEKSSALMCDQLTDLSQCRESGWENMLLHFMVQDRMVELSIFKPNHSLFGLWSVFTRNLMTICYVFVEICC